MSGWIDERLALWNYISWFEGGAYFYLLKLNFLFGGFEMEDGFQSKAIPAGAMMFDFTLWEEYSITFWNLYIK